MRPKLFAAGISLALVSLAGTAHAQGSSVMTHSSCATAMAGAQVAAPCEDGSAVLFNPAAIATQQSVLGAGWSGIYTSGTFTFDDPSLLGVEREGGVASVPFGFATYRMDSGLAFGLGVFAPYGLGIDWPVCTADRIDCDANFEGRFVSYDTELRNIYIQPTVAYELLPGVALGAGLDVVRSSITINQRLDLAFTPIGRTNPLTGQPILFGNLGIAPGTDFADARLEGDGWSVGYHVAAIAGVTDWLSVGARYLSAVETDFNEGTVTFEPFPTGIRLAGGNPFGVPAGTPLDAVVASQFESGALVDQTINTGLTVPAQFVVGVAVTPTERLTINGDYQWTGWEEFDEATLDFEVAPDQVLVLDYQNTDTWRLGAEFWATDALALRGGFIYNTAAQTEFAVSPLLPEAERNYYTGGLGYRFADALQIDLGYQYVDQSDRRGRVRGRAPGLTPAQLQALNVGLYSADAHVFNATLSYRFGALR